MPTTRNDSIFTVVTFALLALVVAVLLTHLVQSMLSPVAGALGPKVCLEDQSCWDCATMGNGICGTAR